MACLEIQLFGVMHVRLEGEPLPRMRSRKGKWLLALLVLQGGTATRACLASTLWPDTDQTVALANLRSVVSDLKAALGSQADRLLTPDRRTLGLNLVGARVDLSDFDALILKSEDEAAVQRYVGPLVQDCDDEWVLQDRRLRERACLQALRRLSDSEANLERAVHWNQRAVEIAPYLDGPRRDLMQALVRNGDLNAALAVYRDFVQKLRSETGGSPDVQTTELYVQLRSGVYSAEVETPATARVASVPSAITSFVGREDEVLEVANLLGVHRLMTLTGLGGIGKTRLAQEVAHSVSGKYPDGAWFVRLEATPSAEAFLLAVANALGVKQAEGKSLLLSVIERIRTKKLLLVLDNCEHILDSCAAFCETALSDCPSLRVLTTSREPLGVMGEKVWLVPGLSTPDTSQLPEHGATRLRVLTGYESVQLFIERASSAHPQFTWDRFTADKVAELCQLLEGIPLAIELAASRARSLSVEAMLQRIQEHRLEILSSRRPTGVARHQTLRAALDWSFSLLSPGERELAIRLSVFVGGWTLEAAESVAKASLDALDALVDKSLVTFSADVRYGMLETVRQYCQEKLVDRSCEVRHLHWYTDHAERLVREGGAREGFEREMGNFRAAARAGELDPEAALKLIGSLGSYWLTVRADEEGIVLMKEALGRPAALKPSDARARALLFLGALQFVRSHKDGRETLLEALVVATEINDNFRMASIHRELALLDFFDANYVDSEQRYLRSLELAREAENDRLTALCLGGLSRLQMAMGQYTEAKSNCDESIRLSRKEGHPRNLAWALRSLGSLAHDLGDYAAMRAANEEAIDLFREAGVNDGVAWCLDDLGKAATETGRLALGADLLAQALEKMHRIGDLLGTATIWQSIGENYLAQGQLDEAFRAFKESQAIFELQNHRLGIARVTDATGDAWAKVGSHEEAHKFHIEALRTWSDIGEQKRIRDSLIRIGDDLTELKVHSIKVWATAHRMSEALQIPIPAPLCARHDSLMAQFRQEPDFTTEWSSSRKVEWPHVVRELLAELPK